MTAAKSTAKPSRTRRPKTATLSGWSVWLHYYYAGGKVKDGFFFAGTLEELLAELPARAEEAGANSATVRLEDSDEVVAAWVRPVSLGEYAYEAYRELPPDDNAATWEELSPAGREAWCAFAGAAAAGASKDDAYTRAYAASLAASGVSVQPWHEIHMGAIRPRFAWGHAHGCASAGVPTAASLVTAKAAKVQS